MMKRYIALAMVLVMICVSTVVYADFTDIPKDAVYADAVNRLSSLGVITGTSKDTFKPKDYVTREQFAVIMVKTAALGDTADSLKGSTVFSDVSPNSPSSGYISLAVSKGFI